MPPILDESDNTRPTPPETPQAKVRARVKDISKERIPGGLHLIEATELEGGVTIQRVFHPEGPTQSTREPYWLVSLKVPPTGTYFKEPAAMAPGSTTGRKSVEVTGTPGYCLELVIFPPRPQDGPAGEGFLVTGVAQGEVWFSAIFASKEQAITAAVQHLRTVDATRRLQGLDDKTSL